MHKVFKIRWINAKCNQARCAEELAILRFEMQMCYLGYRSRGKGWEKKSREMADSPAHVSLAEEFRGSWTDMAAYAKQEFNICVRDVITDSLHM